MKFSRKQLIVAVIIPLALGAILVMTGKIPGLRDNKISSPSQTQSGEIKLISEKTDFKRDEVPELKFQYKKESGSIIDSALDAVGLGKNAEENWKDVKVKAKIIDANGNDTNIAPEIIYGKNGEVSVKMPQGNQGKPGVFKALIEIEDPSNPSGQVTFEQNFIFGVLAINVNKSIYVKGETAYIQMATLNDAGNTICNAALKLEITTPKGKVSILKTAVYSETEPPILSEVRSPKTEDGTISRSETCSGNNVTDNPDYFAYYQVGEAGTYQMTLSQIDANTGTNIHQITDSFEIRDPSTGSGQALPFEVERIGASRINPFKADYTMTIKVKANEDFNGEIVEKVPEEFEIKSQFSNPKSQSNSNDQNPNEPNIKIESADGRSKLKIITWQASLKAGDTVELSYTYSAPKLSPEFYLLGELEFYE